MEPSQSLDRIAALDPVVRAQAAATGIDSQYTADSVVRRYQTRTLADWQTDTSETCDRVEIVAGIGVLVLDADGAHFAPRGPQTAPPPQPLPAPPEVTARRRATCLACERWSGRCDAAGCSCAGLGFPDRLSSRCPLGRWPT